MSTLQRLSVVAAGVALVSFGGYVAPASAALITYSFTGTVGGVDTDLNPPFSNGQTLIGSYTFDSSVAARTGSNSNFAVFDALTNLSFTIGSYTASSTGALEIQVDNDPPSPFKDRYAVVSRASDGLTGAPVNGLDLDFFSFRLDDSTNAVFSDALDLPTSLDFSDFDSSSFFVFFKDSQTSEIFVVTGNLTSLQQQTAQATPEPSAFLGLMALGILGSGSVVKRKLKPIQKVGSN
jgi:hypothetical protein